MKREQKEQVVEELTERLKAADTLLVADYRGLTMPQIDDLRTKLLESGARFTVVKNTLTRRAAEAAGAEALLTLIDGPSAIAFLEPDGDMMACAKALADAARETQVLEIRGGIMPGRVLTATEVATLAKLPPVDVLRGQVLGLIVGPLTAFAGLLGAPLQNFVGLIDARIEQLGGAEAAAEEAPADEEEPAAEETPAAEDAPASEEPVAEDTTEASAEPVASEETTTEEETTDEEESA